MSSIIVALIGAAGSGLGAILGIFINTKLINYRIEQLEKKVEKHNNLIERTYDLEKAEALHEEKIKELEDEIKELK